MRFECQKPRQKLRRVEDTQNDNHIHHDEITNVKQNVFHLPPYAAMAFLYSATCGPGILILAFSRSVSALAWDCCLPGSVPRISLLVYPTWQSGHQNQETTVSWGRQLLMRNLSIACWNTTTLQPVVRGRHCMMMA